MSFEVEVKFPLPDATPVLDRLMELGISWTGTVAETDVYFQHPCRDFGTTDEALRIRRAAGRAFLTYKGPKIDSSTKTRDEVEIELDPRPETVDTWQSLLERLGFRPVAEVRKTRRRGLIPWQGWTIQVSVDEVEELGSYLELEVVVPPERLEDARRSVLELCRHLGLGQSERRSYLELLLEQKGQCFPQPGKLAAEDKR